jgi:integrase
MALSAGVHPKIVQERLGHANIGITLDIYSHVTATLHGEAAEKVADLVFRRS